MSHCGKYRYALWRIWDNSKPIVAFIGLNPSTADFVADDPTIRRVKGFSKAWGFGGIYMLNLFAWRSTDPKVLPTVEDPIGECDKWLLYPTKKIHTVVFAWGSNPAIKIKNRAARVSEMFPNAICLKKNKDGNPWHPLYVASNTEPIYFSTDKKWEGLQP